MNDKYSSYKYCLVPRCKCTTVKTPGKLFFHVPKDPSIRKTWIKAMKREDDVSIKSTLHCCEDHFVLENDMENYWQWCLTKDVKRLKLKQGVVPHRYDCQRTTVPTERPAALKRKRASLIEDALLEATTLSASSSLQPQDDSTSSSSGPGEEPPSNEALHRNVGVQFRSRYRSKATCTEVISTSTVSLSPIKAMTEEIGTSTSGYVISSEDDSEDSDVSEYEEEASSNYSSGDDELENRYYKNLMLESSVMKIEKNPKIFLGLPPQSVYLIAELAKHTSLPTLHIYVVLKKIKLHLSHAILAIDFGLSIASISRIFNTALHKLSNEMQELIVWPAAEEIKLRLPIPFRARYSSVNSIVDCLEIEIEKPSNPIEQSLTWSSYYGCNTIKYLVGCTPDGLVMFVSEGYGGRTSDLVIFKESSFMKNLSPGTAVMADRGFKHIAPDLQQIGCSVVRPPSVISGVKSSKGEVKESQRIAALRIHVERVIGRIREFKMLSPHACINYKQICSIDKCIIVACGIINLQERLFKK